VAIQVPLWEGTSCLSAKAYCAADQDGAGTAAFLYVAASHTSSVICAAAGCDGSSAQDKRNLHGYHRQNEEAADVPANAKCTGHQINGARPSAESAEEDSSRKHSMGMELVRHLVVLMLENRSFDDLVGYVYAGDGNRLPINIPQPAEGSPTTYDGLSKPAADSDFWNPSNASFFEDPSDLVLC
jgi:phospholipase C